MSHAFDPNVLGSILVSVKILQSHSRSHKHHDLPPNDSSFTLGTKIVEVSRLEARVFFLDYRKRMIKVKTLNP